MRSVVLGLILLLLSSPAFSREDSLKRAYPWEFYTLIEDLYSTDQQSEEAIEYFDLLTASDLVDLRSVPGISSTVAFRINRQDTLNWLLLDEELGASSGNFLTSLIRAPRYFWSSRSRVQVDPLAHTEPEYNDGRILGSPYKIYDRLLLSQYGLQAGLLQVKDVGERNALDHLRGYLLLTEQQQLADDITIDRIIAGDYSLGFGSGLLFSSGGIIGKSNEVIDAVEPSTAGIRGYLSSSIGIGFRGVASAISLGSFTSNIFYSNRSYDARISDDTITSMPEDGYHRTGSEEEKINAAKSNLVGAHLNYSLRSSNSNLQFGATAYTERFSLPVNGRGFNYNFKGRSLSMASQNGLYTDSLIGISYEAALSSSEHGDAIGGVISAVIEPSRLIQFSLNGRYLSHNFVSRHGATFGESTDDAQNERGIYAGVKYRPFRSLAASAYFDLSSTLVPPHNESNIFKTTEGLLLLEYDLSQKMRVTSRTRWKRKSDEMRSNGIDILGYRDQLNTRFEHEWTIVQDFRVRTRCEYVSVKYGEIFDNKQEDGLVISSGVRGRILESSWFEARVTAFNTRSYDSRLYIYENDLQGASGLVMLYGSGMRYGVILASEIVDGVQLSAKYGITVYSQERTFGDGPTERYGRTDPKLGAQLDLAF